jgi:rhodanese-related sulfurtransferase
MFMRRLALAAIAGICLLTVGCSAASPAAPAPTGTTSMPAEMTGMPNEQAMAGAGAGAVTQADPQSFAAAIAAGRTVINVHTPNQGSITGTNLTIPFDQLESRAGELPKDRDTALAVYCMTGNMSDIAGQTLTRLGYTNILELRGGMTAWQSAGLPLIPPDQ